MHSGGLYQWEGRLGDWATGRLGVWARVFAQLPFLAATASLAATAFFGNFVTVRPKRFDMTTKYLSTTTSEFEITDSRWSTWWRWQLLGSFFGALLLCLLFLDLAYYATQPIVPTTPLCGRIDDKTAHFRRKLRVSPHGNLTCAVVGSAGFLRVQRLGREIDAHDFVIRANLAPVVGFEEIVGAKTSLRVLNSEAAGAILLEKSCSLDANKRESLCPDYPIYLNTADSWLVYKFKALCPKNVIFDSSDLDAFDPAMRAQWQGLGTNLMSGSWALGIAMKICKTTTLYGVTHENTFGRFANSSYHYFDSRRMSTLDSLPTSARSLSTLAAAQTSCLSLHSPSNKSSSTFELPPNSSLQGRVVDRLVDDVVHNLPRKMYIGWIKTCSFGLTRLF